MTYSIISGMSQHFFHIIPSDLDLITTAPTREGIFSYLSQIGYYRFPEFILDILIKVEGHIPVDVTDGPGDEKQDILTLDKAGMRFLTQCKHTIDYNSNYTGDDLDILVVACIRKNCKSGLLVTNSDLTPQGKRYITDREYSRSNFGQQIEITIDYWNGFKIWEKIKNNQDIINKWFSGLGQVHGLRSFKFDLTIQELPYKSGNANDENAFDNILKSLSKKPWVKENTPGLLYKAEISNEFTLMIKRWFQFSGNLDINFLLPEDDQSFFDKPLYALTFEVVLNSSTSKYSPKRIQEKIIKKICDGILNITNNKNWFHLTCSQIKSIIYLHDISEPREIILRSATTFIKTDKTNTYNELAYISFSEKEFKIKNDDTQDTIWIHKPTNIEIVQLFEQKFNPVELYNYQIQQSYDLSKISNYMFFAVERVDSIMMMRVRQLLRPEWFAFQYNDSTLYWAIDPITDKELVNHHHQLITEVGLEIQKLKKEDSDRILEESKNDFISSRWIITSDLNSLSFPISLNRRTFWLSKEIILKKPMDVDLAIELVKFKYDYEHHFGFDNLFGQTEQKINSHEIQGMLFNFFTVRGRRMLDIGTLEKSISVNVRYSDGKLSSSQILIKEYIDEFKKTYKKIKSILDNNSK